MADTDLGFANPLNGFIGDPVLDYLLGDEKRLDFIREVECAFISAQSSLGNITLAEAETLQETINNLPLDLVALNKSIREDGLIIPALVKQWRQALPENLSPFLHQGLTSQDVLDSALMLALKGSFNLISERLALVENSLIDLSQMYGRNKLMARTRMQTALPMTVSDRIKSWLLPFTEAQAKGTSSQSSWLRLQCGGPIGTGDSFGAQASQLIELMANTLSLTPSPNAWHNQRGRLAEIAQWLTQISGALGKMGLDMALMAQQGIDDMALIDGGGSSAMPHKQNPVKAEGLTALARFNAVLISGMNQALLHEQERSGAAWGLENLTLPLMVKTTGRALLLALPLLEGVASLGKTAD